MRRKTEKEQKQTLAIGFDVQGRPVYHNNVNNNNTKEIKVFYIVEP